MFFLFSGEGPTDLGTCIHPDIINHGENYLYGPLAVVVDQIVKERHSCSFIELGVFAFVPAAMLVEHATTLRPKPKSIGIPGVKIKKETRFFYRNARALAQIAIQFGQDINQNNVVAVLFRDGEAPNDRGNWESKRDSMFNGFEEEDFKRGVPMIPASVSEAWMLCGLYKKSNPAQDYSYLENVKYGSGGQHQLKDELEK